jgi:hypothetical protein
MSGSRTLTRNRIAELQRQFVERAVQARLLKGMENPEVDAFNYLTTMPDPAQLETWLSYWHSAAKHMFTEEEKAEFEEKIAVEYLPRAARHAQPDSGPMVFFTEYLSLTGNAHLRVYDCGNAGYLVKYKPWRETKFILLNGNKSLVLQPADFVVCFAEYLGKGREDSCEMSRGVEFITGRLREAIEQIQKDAAKNYGKACAVDPERVRIVCANEVYVVDESGVQIFAANLFADEKIELPARTTRRNFNTDHEFREALVIATDFVQKNEVDNFFLTGPENERVLVVSARYAPRITLT